MTKIFSDKDKWNQRYSAVAGESGSEARELVSVSRVVADYAHLLPEQGTALDLACGSGANAVYLAKHGLDTYAWDIADVAISMLEQTTAALDIKLNLEVRDVSENPPLENSFDVIVVSRFLDRKIIPRLMAALKPNGLIYYQTFIVDKHAGTGPNNPDYLLKPNELLELFKSLTIRVYREEGLVGDTKKGFRNEAMMVAQKVS